MKRRPLQVLMTADAVGGVWTYALDLASGLQDQGLSVTLAVLGPSPSQTQRDAAGARNLTVVDTGLPLDWLAPDAATIAAGARSLGELAHARGADLVHLNSPAFAAGAGFGVPVVGACHSCLATWWSAVRGGPLPDDFRWRTELLGRGYGACDALIAPSFAFAQATLAHYRVLPRGVRNGRDATGRVPGRAEKGRYVLTSGRLWDAGKNIAALDAAAALMDGEVLAAGPLAGPGGDAASVAAVRPLGTLSATAMTEQLNAAPVFASLALYEPFGLGVLEAAQAGCALVLSDIPSFRELWDGAAVFVSPEDPATVAATLDRLLDDDAEAARLGQLAAARAAAFTVEAMVKATLEVYRDVLCVPRELAGAA